jgi:hypothetical protein
MAPTEFATLAGGLPAPPARAHRIAAPDALRVTYKITMEIESGKRPACVAEVIGQHYR